MLEPIFVPQYKVQFFCLGRHRKHSTCKQVLPQEIIWFFPAKHDEQVNEKSAIIEKNHVFQKFDLMLPTGLNSSIKFPI